MNPGGLLLIIVGIAIGMLLHYGLGVLVVLIGLLVLVWPLFDRSAR